MTFRRNFVIGTMTQFCRGMGGEQGIWMLIIPSMENTECGGKNNKTEHALYRKNFKVLKMFMYVLDSGMVLLQYLAFVANSELGNTPVMEWGYSIRLHGICDCSLERISSSICPWRVVVVESMLLFLFSMWNNTGKNWEYRENTGNFIFI